MKVGAFIKWLETQDQNLEVCVMEKSEEWAYGYDGGERNAQSGKLLSRGLF